MLAAIDKEHRPAILGLADLNRAACEGWEAGLVDGFADAGFCGAHSCVLNSLAVQWFGLYCATKRGSVNEIAGMKVIIMRAAKIAK